MKRASFLPRKNKFEKSRQKVGHPLPIILLNQADKDADNTLRQSTVNMWLLIACGLSGDHGIHHIFSNQFHHVASTSTSKNVMQSHATR